MLLLLLQQLVAAGFSVAGFGQRLVLRMECCGAMWAESAQVQCRALHTMSVYLGGSW
jgi:hypothetical protein